MPRLSVQLKEAIINDLQSSENLLDNALLFIDMTDQEIQNWFSSNKQNILNGLDAQINEIENIKKILIDKKSNVDKGMAK